MKYVVYLDGGKEHLVAFPRCINHDHMAQALEYLRFVDDRGWHRRHGKVVSAGFIDGGECHGRSESLDMDSRKGRDTALYKAGGVLPEAVPDVVPAPQKCRVCGTSEGVTWVGGSTPYLCRSLNCVPF